MSFYLLEGVLSKWRYIKVADITKERKAILEIGCGKKASFLRSLIDLPDKKLIGIEPQLNQKYLKFGNLTLIKKDLTDKINLPDNSVDCVIMLAVLEHLDYPQEIINEIYRILEPRGVICLTAPTFSAKKIIEFIGFLRLIDPQMVAQHKRYFNKNVLEDMTQQAGFNKTEHRYFQLGFNNFLIAYK